jgi:hypothetical protein
MYGQDFGRLVGEDSAEAERTFHEKLSRLEAEGASNQEISETVIRDTFVLALVWIVTEKKTLTAGQGARPPFDWKDRLAREPELRDEWRCETVRILGERLRKKRNRQDDDPKAKCDLTRESIGGYWRVKITFAAIKAAWNLRGESRLKFRRSRKPIYCYGEEMPEVRDKTREEGSQDLALDLMEAINELENPRQRAVMQLSLLGYTYQEIAQKLTEGNSSDAGRVTYEMVRGAFEKAREILKKRLKLGPPREVARMRA